MQLIRRQDSQTPSVWNNNFSSNDFMERILNDFWKPFGIMPRADHWIPRVDVVETKDAYKIKADIPGVDPKDVSVEVVDNNTLQIQGKTQQETKEDNETWYRVERQTGEFSRSFTLPENVDADNISADCKHGTIIVTLPKKPEAAPMRKAVKINN